MNTLTDKQLIARLESDLINADANYSDLKADNESLKAAAKQNIIDYVILLEQLETLKGE
jgi:hypothetical protein